MSDKPQPNYVFNQNFAFSTDYLDCDIPDFRQMIEEAIPVCFNGNDLEVRKCLQKEFCIEKIGMIGIA